MKRSVWWHRDERRGGPFVGVILEVELSDIVSGRFSRSRYRVLNKKVKILQCMVRSKVFQLKCRG